MSFFDLTKYRNDEYGRRKLEDENKRLQEEAEMRRYRERRDDYDREQQDRRTQERVEQQRENDREFRLNMINRVEAAETDLEDLKLRRKFGVEEGE